MSTPSTVQVTVAIGEEDALAGTAYFQIRRGVVSTTFRYNDDYLARAGAYAIDPAMPLFQGNHQVAGLPGAFQDCAPDRWGRSLVLKRIRADALREGRHPPTVTDVDFLLGVSDITRQGALRFRTPEGNLVGEHHAIPKLISLPNLLRAADSVARDGGDLAAVKLLLDAGTGSLGGARPKASVQDGSRLLIAKFPHFADEWDVMAWEKTALDLAQRVGIPVPRGRLAPVDDKNVLLLDRFDRRGERRVGYISAMTLLNEVDGASRDYVEIAEALSEHGAAVAKDLEQLWLRAAFSMFVRNTDDHLRNHGFLRDRAGWALAPMFDINPNPVPDAERITGIGGAYSRRDELGALVAYASSFGLSEKTATRTLGELAGKLAYWRTAARANGIAEQELQRFASTFDWVTQINLA